jgi:phage-related protein
MESKGRPAKPLKWVGSSKGDLLRFPEIVRKEIGYAIYLAQIGLKATNAKPLRGFGGAGVLEVVQSHRGDTYRAVYTVRFADYIFVLHVFQKKSKKGIETPRAEVELIRSRLQAAGDFHAALQGAKRS